MNTLNQPETPNMWHAPKPEPAESGPQRTRNGHIARLPKALRDIVNRMLDDARPHQEILDELENTATSGLLMLPP